MRYFNHFNSILSTAHTHTHTKARVHIQHTITFSCAQSVCSTWYCVSERLVMTAGLEFKCILWFNVYCFWTVATTKTLVTQTTYSIYVLLCIFGAREGESVCVCHATKIGQQYNKLNVLHKTNEAIHNDEALIKWQMFVFLCGRKRAGVSNGKPHRDIIYIIQHTCAQIRILHFSFVSV